MPDIGFLGVSCTSLNVRIHRPLASGVAVCGALPSSGDRKPKDEIQCQMTRQAACGGRCIPVAWLCSGEQECPDGADEQCGSFRGAAGIHASPLPCCALEEAN
ncbi:CD320 antigen-like [Tursiops truncatus]|uniref:CD320 antigen-like n=1 Tax=Tursiops truncatus TaxID=9739 RepID=A0A6J3QR43_TURTR|nr:CD320 antigen-like [Tursiops truncatus]